MKTPEDWTLVGTLVGSCPFMGGWDLPAGFSVNCTPHPIPLYVFPGSNNVSHTEYITGQCACPDSRGVN